MFSSYHGNMIAGDAQDLRELSVALVGLEEISEPWNSISTKYRRSIWDSEKLLYFTDSKTYIFVHMLTSLKLGCILKPCPSLDSSIV